MKHTQGDGKIKTGAFLAEIGGGEVDCVTSILEVVATVEEGTFDTVPGFFDRCIGQSDDHEVGQAATYIYFHLNGECLDTDDAGGLKFGVHFLVLDE